MKDVECMNAKHFNALNACYRCIPAKVSKTPNNYKAF